MSFNGFQGFFDFIIIIFAIVTILYIVFVVIITINYKKITKKQIGDIIFICVFFGILIIPLITFAVSSVITWFVSLII